MIQFWDPNPAGAYEQLYQATEWDRLVIGGQIVPGICEVSASAKYKMDNTSAPGKKGGKSRNAGYQPTDVDIRVHIWTPDQWIDFQPLLEYLWPSKKVAQGKTNAPSAASVKEANNVIAQATALVASGQTPTAQQDATLAAAQATIIADNLAKKPDAARNPIAVYHPELALLGISNLQIVGMATPNRGAAHQEKVFSIKAREFLPPTNVNVKNPVRADITAGPLSSPQLASQEATPSPENGPKPKPSSGGGAGP